MAKSKAAHLLRKRHQKFMSLEEWTKKNQANSLAETREATVSVTRRVHIKNKANSQAETRWATVSVTKRVNIKDQASLPAETRQATVCHQKSAH